MSSIDQKDSSTLPVFVKPVQKPDGQKSASTDAETSNSFSHEVEKMGERGEVDETPSPNSAPIVDLGKEQSWPIWDAVEGDAIEVEELDALQPQDGQFRLVGEVAPPKKGVELTSLSDDIPIEPIKSSENGPVKADILTVSPVSEADATNEAELISRPPSADNLKEGSDAPLETIAPKEAVKTERPLVQNEVAAIVAPKEPIAVPVQTISVDGTLRKRDVEPAIVQASIRPKVDGLPEKPKLEQPINGSGPVLKPDEVRLKDLPIEDQKLLVPQTRTPVAQPQAPVQPTTVSVDATFDVPIDPIVDDIDLGRGLEQINVKDRLSAQPLSPQSTAQLNSTVARQIFGQLSAGLSQLGQGGIEIRLNPAELGRITIQILEGSLGQSANVLVEKPEVLDLLKKNENLLQSEFDGAGFESLSFTFDQQDHPDADQEAEFSAGTTETGSKHQTMFVEPTLIRTSADLDIRL